MDERAAFVDTFLEPRLHDLVSFSVVCAPRSGVSLEELRRRLSVSTLDESLPTDKVRDHVADQLRKFGFQLFDLPSPVVSATGTVELFQTVFAARLSRRVERSLAPTRRVQKHPSCSRPTLGRHQMQWRAPWRSWSRIRRFPPGPGYRPTCQRSVCTCPATSRS